jgi:nucleoside-triphosphatase THEP1
MIYVVTGPRNSGKTTRVLSIYRETGEGDGFVTPKHFREGEFLGYDIIGLANRSAMPFAYLADRLPPGWNEAYGYGPFSFSDRALRFGESVLTDALRKGAEPLYLDEVGPLELEGRGFFEAVQRLVAAERTAYMSVRTELVQQVIAAFGIDEYEMIEV